MNRSPLAFIVVMVLAIPILSACAIQLTERAIIRPVAGGTLGQEAVSLGAPAYTVTDHTIVASDGVRLHAVLLRQPQARGTVLYFGGNGYTMERFGAATASIFVPLGMDLMLVDHRGYGLSEGVPSIDLLETDGTAVFDYLAGLSGVDPAHIVVHGQSLGSFTAGYVAAHRDVAGVVLESSVTSTEEWVRAMMGSAVEIAPALQGRGNLRHMGTINEPLLILVGEADRTTPAQLSRDLFAASTLPIDRKVLGIVPGAGHNDVLRQAEAIATYQTFLTTALH